MRGSSMARGRPLTYPFDRAAARVRGLEVSGPEGNIRSAASAYGSRHGLKASVKKSKKNEGAFQVSFSKREDAPADE